MEDFITLKRKSTETMELSIICTEASQSESLTRSDHGLTVIEQCAEERKALNDQKYKHAVEQIENITEQSKILWHIVCYSDFSHVGKFKRLKKGMASTSTASSTGPPLNTLRINPIKWDLCLVCQKIK